MADHRLDPDVVVVSQPAHNQKRKATFWEWFARVVVSFTAVGGSWGTYKWYQSYTEMKPLYDTFQTKSEAEASDKRSQETIRELKELAKNYQKLTIENTSALNMLTDKLDTRHKDAQVLHKTLIDDNAKNKLDIANIKFIMGLKNN